MKLPASVIRQIRRRMESVVQDAVWEHAEDVDLPENVSVDWGEEIIEAMMGAAEDVDAPGSRDEL